MREINNKPAVSADTRGILELAVTYWTEHAQNKCVHIPTVMAQFAESIVEQCCKAMCVNCRLGLPLTTNGELEICHYSIGSHKDTKLLQRCDAEPIRSRWQRGGRTVWEEGIMTKLNDAQIWDLAVEARVITVGASNVSPTLANIKHFVDRLAASQPGEPLQPRCPKCGAATVTLVFTGDDKSYGFCHGEECGQKEPVTFPIAKFFGPSAPQPQASDTRHSSTFGDLPNAVREAEIIEPHEWDNKNISDQRDWALDQLANRMTPSPLPTYEEAKPHMGYGWPGFSFDGKEHEIRYVYDRMRDAMQKYLGVGHSPKFKCGAQDANQGSSDYPQDCDWPFCGCDERATKVIETLIECGWKSPKEFSGVAPSGSAGQEPLRISFDIGGVLSKYPEVFRPMVAALQAGGAEVYVITDMHEHEKSVRFVRENGYDIPAERILNSDYTSHGEGCKAETIKQNRIQIHLDDFAGYCAHTKCVSLFVWPNPSKPYYADDFKTDGTEGDFGRRKAAKI